MKPRHHKYIFLAIPLAVGVFFLIGWLVQLIWNATITDIFGSNPISYWQGIMLIILFKILMGGNFSVRKDKKKKFDHHAHFFHSKQHKPETDVNPQSSADEEINIEI